MTNCFIHYSAVSAVTGKQIPPQMDSGNVASTDVTDTLDKALEIPSQILNPDLSANPSYAPHEHLG